MGLKDKDLIIYWIWGPLVLTVSYFSLIWNQTRASLVKYRWIFHIIIWQDKKQASDKQYMCSGELSV